MSRKGLFLFLAVVVVLVSSLFFQQNRMKEQMQLKIQFIEQKNMLRDELDDIIDEHDDLLDEYGELNDQLHDKDSIIQHQIAEIRNLIRTKKDLKEAKKKIFSLKAISKRYLANIDSLLVVNEALLLEKDSVVKVNKDINWKNYKLNKQNKKLSEKVSKGSILELSNVEVKSLRYRSTGREVSTRYAKKVQKVRTCFVIAANQISDSEEKSVYMQLIDNEGSLVVGVKDFDTQIGDSIVHCTSYSNFYYDNEEISYCFEWERLHKLLSGKYTMKLIIENNLAAKTTFKLR